MRNFILILLLLSVNFTVCAHEIALTWDDLPGQQPKSYEFLRDINCRILNSLEKYHVPAVGFVIEGNLFLNGNADKMTEILQLWIDHGFPLGNHTYSHKSLSATPLEEFQEDVLRGSLITKQLMQKASFPYRYFRHPFLDLGNSKMIRSAFGDFLKKEGYTVAPITMDTKDWMFNSLLLKKPQNKDKIIARYLEYTKKRFAYFKNLSNRLFGRNIKQIWLLHVNLLNAYAIDKLLKIAQNFGYTFITLDRALEDKAYLTPDTYYTNNGISWLYRWNITRRNSLSRTRLSQTIPGATGDVAEIQNTSSGTARLST